MTDTEQLLHDIAREHLLIPTLEPQRSDRLDFHSVSVWGVEAALKAAYNAGRNKRHDPARPAEHRTERLNVQVQAIERHRNGICGAPFHVVLFRDKDEGPMLGIVFEQRHHVAVLQTDRLANGDIAFRSNSWRGDRYEPLLRAAIAADDRHNETEA